MKSILIVLIAVIGFCSCIPTVDQLQSQLSNEVLQSLLPSVIAPMLSSVDKLINQFLQIVEPFFQGRADGVNIFQFLYDNIVADLVGGLATNTAGYLQNALNNLLNKPFGVGKRDLQGDLAARVDFLSFLYDNILQDFFSGIVTNTFSTLSGALNNLISTNPLGVGKRAEGVNIFQFLYDNVIADLFGGLASNTANYLQNSLNNLLNKPFGIGKRSIDAQQIQAMFSSIIAPLVQKLKAFAQQAVALFNNGTQLTQLAQSMIAQIKAAVASLAQQLSQFIPSTVINEVSELLAGLQSMLVYWTSGLAGSLGPVIIPH